MKFDLRDIEAGLRKTMTAADVTRAIENMITARIERLLEANTEETKQVLRECEHLSGDKWMEKQGRISVLFAEHAELCESLGKATA
jgi:hypothetical protein